MNGQKNISRWTWLISTIVLSGFLSLQYEARSQYFEFGKNRVQYDDQDWEYIQSQHFDIFFYQDSSTLASFTAEAAEAAYQNISDIFGHQVGRRIPILVYAAPPDFGVTRIVDLPFEASGIGGLTESFKNRVALPFSGNYAEYRRVLEHELVHAVLNDLLYGGTVQSLIRSNIRIHLPLWFDEGLAEYVSTGWDSESDSFIRDVLLTNSLPPIAELDGYLAYKGGQSVWDYIAAQYGIEKISELLRTVKQTRSVDRAVQLTTGLEIPDLSKRWHQSLKEIHFPEVAARESFELTARLITDDGQGYNASPVLSPRGDRVAYVAADRGAFSIFISGTGSGVRPKLIARGSTTNRFESLRILTTGLSWNPSGDLLAAAVTSSGSEAISIMNLRTGRNHSIDVPDLDYIRSIDWSPDGNSIVIEGIEDGKPNLFVLDLDSAGLSQITDDSYAAHDPVWNPAGTHIVFHSNRKDRWASSPTSPDEVALSTSNLFMVDVKSLELVQLTSDISFNNRNASFGSDTDKMMFESDRNGVYNLFELDLTTGSTRPLTNLLTGVSQSTMSSDGSRIAMVTSRKGSPDIFVTHVPFVGKNKPASLPPTLWAHRRDGGTSGQSITVNIPGSTLGQSNPFVRDALDGLSFSETWSSERMLASNLPVTSDTEEASNEVFPLMRDSSGVNIGFNSSDPRDVSFVEASVPANAALITDNLDEDGNYRVRKYKLRFSPDIVYGTAGYDVLYGVQGITQMRFSDMIGYHRLMITTNLLIDLRNSDYVVAYQYAANRLSWEYSLFQVSRLLPDFDGERPTYLRFRQSGATVQASWPFDKFHRLDVDVSVVTGSQADIAIANSPARQRTFMYPSATLTRDVTAGGRLYPIAGRRVALSVAGSPGAIDGRQSRFFTVLGDARNYVSTRSGSVTLATRLSMGVSTGVSPQLFYSSGVQNWINRGIDDTNGFPIQNAADFIFATPVLPLRGLAVNERSGSSFALTNVEVRVPLHEEGRLPGLSFIPASNFTMTGFVDSGIFWRGNEDERRLNIFADDANGNRAFDDLVVGTGFGLRSLLFGYPTRMDIAWPFDGQRFGRHQLYFSVGFDF